MVNVDKLKVEMFACNITHAQMAKKLGISPKTFGTRLKKKIFMSNEIEMMIDILKLSIEKAMAIFFDKNVTS